MAAPIPPGPKVWPLLKFTWGSPRLERGHWRGRLFAFYSATPGFPASGLAINLRAALGWSCGLAAAGYLAAALAFTQWFRSQPHNRIGFADVLTWPVRRPEVARLRGRAWLAQGKEALGAQRWAEGVFYLRRGLEVCPDDLDARIMLGQFYLLTGQRARAMELLVEGPRHAVPSRAWLESVFQIMVAGEEWGSLLRICDSCLARPDAHFPPVLRQRILERKAEALIGLERPAEALALAEAEGDAAAPALKTQRARALLALGRAEDALAFLARWYKEAMLPADRAAIQQLHVRALRESGQLDAMERELDAICAANPTYAAMAAFAVEQRARAGRGAAAALDSYIFRFGGSEVNLKIMVRLLAEIPDVPLARRVATEAAARGYPIKSYDAAVATALLRAGDWPGLARAVQAMAPAYSQADGGSRLWYTWMKGLAEELTAPPGVHPTTVDYFAKNLVSLEAHQLSVAALHRAGRLEAARDLLVVSRQLYPESRVLRDEQVAVTRELAAQDAALAAVAPRPAETAAPLEADDFFRQVDAALAARQWTAARDLISGVRTRRPAPPWLGGADADLLRRELRADQALGDTPALQLAVRLLLNSGPDCAGEVLAFARDLDAAGAKADARLLAGTVLAKYPDDDSAKDLLASWARRDAAQAP